MDSSNTFVDNGVCVTSQIDTERGLYTRQDRDPAAVSRLSASTRCMRNSGDVSSCLDVPKEDDSVSTRNCRGKTAPNRALNSHFRRSYLKAGQTPVVVL